MPTGRLLPALLTLAVVTAACAGSSEDTTPALPSIPDSLPPATATTLAGPALSGCRLAVGDPRGAEVLSVMLDSPAAAALRTGDVIVAVDGNPTTTAAQVVTELQERGVGASAVLTIERGGTADTTQVDLELVENPEEPGTAMIGAMIRTLADELPPAEIPLADGADDRLARVVAIDGNLFLLDDAGRRWERLDQPEPAGPGGWIAFDGDVLVLEQGDAEQSPALVGLVSGSRTALNIGDWSAQRVFGPFGNLVLVAAARPGAGSTGVPVEMEEGLIAVDAGTGRLAWEWVAAAEDIDPQFAMPVPIEVFVDPSQEAVVVSVFFPTFAGVGSVVLDRDGNQLTSWPPPQGGFLPLGALPRGWFDSTRVMYVDGTEGTVFVEDVSTATSEATDVDISGLDGIWPTGDGQTVLARDGVSLRLIDAEGGIETGVLAHGCDVGAPSEPSWARGAPSAGVES